MGNGGREMGAKLLRSYRAGKGTRWVRPVQNASRIWEELAWQPELPQCEQMEFLAGRQEAASCIFSAGVHFSQQVFPQKKTLLVLTKDWPKFKNCTKLGTHPASAFEVNGQTGEHCCHSHTWNCHSHHKTCHKPVCPLPKVSLHPNGSSSFFPPFSYQGLLTATVLWFLQPEAKHSFNMN